MISYRYILSSNPRKAYRAIIRELFDEEIRRPAKNLAREKVYLNAAAHLHEQIRNGGISQYFTSAWNKGPLAGLEGLRAIGANEQLVILHKWLDKLPPGVNPNEPLEVGQYIFGNQDLLSELQHLDEEYFSRAESFYAAVVRYVRNNPAAFETES